MTAPPTTRPRTLGLVCAGLLASAAALWGASVAVWFRLPSAGARVVDITGGELRPALGGVALLALAGVAGVLATSGILRRVVGALLGVAGASVAVTGAVALLDPSGTGTAALPEPSAGTADALRAVPVEVTPAPLLAVLGGLLLLVVGVVALLRERGLSRFGSRYAAAGSRPPADPDRSAWQDLDAGLDPTDPDRPVDPDGGASGRAG